ncbi:MAG: hypothetical protein M3Y18_03275 [Candidatus Eremiobacteraeota bacterium]|nr:hypothetical protein [Candidatus Eremiobacteraeota bacterium]
MTSDFGALAYLQCRQAVNFVKKTLRAPGRVVLYLFGVAYFVGLLFFRTRYPKMSGAYHGIPDPYATAAFFGVVAFLAVTCLIAAAGRVGPFSGPADARFIIGSKLRERNVILWLQLRTSWFLLGRFLIMALIYSVVFPQVGTVSGMTLTIMGIAALSSTCAMPILRAQVQGFGKALTAVLSVILYGSFAAGLCAVASLLLPAAGHLSGGVVHLGLGRIITGLLSGNAEMLTVLYVLVVAGIALSFFGSTDLYPELYASSLKTVAWRAARRRNPFGTPFQSNAQRSQASPQRIASGTTNAAGAWTTVWKDWVVFRRSRAALVVFGLSLLGAIVAGVVAGAAARISSDAIAPSIGIASSLGFVIVIFLTLGASISLAEDVRKPIWWLSTATLRQRLYVWLGASSWRTAACVSAGLIAWAAVLHSVAFALLGTVAAVCAVLFVRCIGLALYAIFPSKLDQRGPVAMIRLLLVYVLLAPVAATATVTGIFARSGLAGGAAGIAVLIFEGFFLAEFAVRRVAGVGAALAQAEET